MRRSNRSIFTDIGPELTKTQQAIAQRRARHAAIEAQRSWTLTAKKQYRRYRDAAGDTFMAWSEWHQHYLDTYNEFSTVAFQPGGRGLASSSWGSGAGLL